MALANSTQLGCGHDIDEVWSHVDAPPNAHEIDCPDCQGARESLAALNTATQQLRDQDRNDPTLRLGSDVLTQITSLARAEVRRSNRIPLRYPPPGADAPDLTVSQQAITTVIRRAADRNPGLEARHARVQIINSGAGSGHDQPVAVTVTLTLSVSPDQPIPDRVAALRIQLIDAVASEIGVHATTVNIHIEDIHDA